jgi:perosamine synthetase
MSDKLPDAILRAVRSVVHQEDGTFIALHEPQITGRAWEYVKDCLDSGWVSSVGDYVNRFERMLSEYTGARYAVATVNGTAALHTALVVAGVQPGDEVIMPTLTFVATANAVSYTGAVPHLADVSESTLGLDVDKLFEHLSRIGIMKDGVLYNRQTNRPIRAVVPMHTFGHPVEMAALMDLCEHFRILLVEDAAESLGTSYRGKHTGTFGIASALSFNGNKIVTTGGGGAILTNDETVAKRAKHLTTTAKQPHAWEYIHDEIGFNYRMPNLNAALGCSQLEMLPQFLQMKRKLFQSYKTAFDGIPHVKIFEEPPEAYSNYWLQTMILDRGYEEQRNEVLGALNAAGVMSRPVWRLMHQLPMYESCPRMDLSTAESLEQRLLNIPSGVSILKDNLG